MSCLRLFEQRARETDSRTRCTADAIRPMRMPMMAMTTISSMSVKAGRVEPCRLLRDWTATCRLMICLPMWRGNMGPSLDRLDDPGTAEDACQQYRDNPNLAVVGPAL